MPVQISDPEYIEVLLRALSRTTDFFNHEHLQEWEARTRKHLGERSRKQLRRGLQLMDPTIGPSATIFTRNKTVKARIMNEWVRRMQNAAAQRGNQGL